jgi:GntR family transcriptional regulator/MocR family aminotransferase
LLVVSVGKKIDPSPKLVFVKPSFQPIASMMSLARRFDLLGIARTSNTWILEDDYSSEYLYGGSAIASLQSIDQNQRVIYIGDFSKSIAPLLRIGYLDLPPALVENFPLVLFTMSRQPPGVEQGHPGRNHP